MMLIRLIPNHSIVTLVLTPLDPFDEFSLELEDSTGRIIAISNAENYIQTI
jgi:hypothetical protein